MPAYRPKISNAAKKRLRAEAGQKCANPGCPNRRTHIHHIREWAAYETHDEGHMIAVCPTCHDAIHHGKLRLDDATLYQWKSIPRTTGPLRSHFYIEPGPQSKILLGTIAVTAPTQAVIFELSPLLRLKFAIKEGDILLVELAVSTLNHEEVLRVVDNHVRFNERRGLKFTQVTGTIEVVASPYDRFLPTWVAEHMKSQEPHFGDNDTVRLLGISVLKPGLVRVEGVWAQADRAVVATKERLSFLRPELPQPLSLVGEGEHSVLSYDGSGVIGLPLFGFGPNSVLDLGSKR